MTNDIHNTDHSEYNPTETPLMDSIMTSHETAPVATATAATLPKEAGVTFASFNLPPALMRSLDRMNYETPTPVRAQAIPSALMDKDVLASAQTGTGKTAAFCIPMIARLLREGSSKALIMTPTRELATQISVVLQQMLANNRDIRTALLIGGDSMFKQFEQLRAEPRIIIGTPGRINDHLRRNAQLLRGTDLVVLDEADRMLDMGFSVQIDTIFAKVDQERQTLMFSATFPDSILKFARQYLKDPVRVSVNPAKITAENIKHETLETSEATRYDDLVQQLDTRTGSIIVFVKTKHGADRLSQRLDRENHDVGVIHGGLKQRQRDRAIQGFRAGKVRIMIATDVAARGLDVPHIEHVINYDLPQNPEDYIHRIGRTARAGKQGNAVAFLMPSERGKWNAIDRILNPGKKSERGESRGGGRDGGRPSYRGGRDNNSERGGYRGAASRSGAGRPAGGRDYARPQGGRPFHERPKKERANTGNEDWFNDQADQLVQLREGEAPRMETRDEPNRRAHNTQRRDMPRGERSHAGRTMDAPRNRTDGHGGEHRRPQGDRMQADRPQGDRPRSDKPHADRPHSDRPRGDRPQGDRPQGNREGGHKPAWMGKRTERSEGFRPQREGQSHDAPRQNAPRAGKPEGRRDSGLRKEGYPQRNGAAPRGDRPQGDRPRSFGKDGPRRHSA